MPTNKHSNHLSPEIKHASMSLRQKPKSQRRNNIPHTNSRPTERSNLFHHPPFNPLSLYTPPRHRSPQSALQTLFTHYEKITCLANELLAVMQETYYRIVPEPFDVKLLSKIEQYRPQLLMATKRFKQFEWAYGSEVGSEGEYGRQMEWEVDALEGLIRRAQEALVGVREVGV